MILVHLRGTGRTIRLIINRNKFDWETLNTPKIRAVVHSSYYSDNDFGTKIRFKCHKPIQRKATTIYGELCTNWNLIDSFGVRLDFDDSIYHTDSYKNFYDDPTWLTDDWIYTGNGL